MQGRYSSLMYLKGAPKFRAAFDTSCEKILVYLQTTNLCLPKLQKGPIVRTRALLRKPNEDMFSYPEIYQINIEHK